MAEGIGPIKAEIRLAEILGEDLFAQVPSASPVSPAPAAGTPAQTGVSGNIFEDILSTAIQSLNGVSRSEAYANQLIDKYMRGEAELHDVMVAQSKMSIMVQLAVATINQAVASFKEITQIQM